MDYKAHATSLQEAKTIPTTQHHAPAQPSDKEGEGENVVSANLYETLDENFSDKTATHKPRDESETSPATSTKKYVPPTRNPDAPHDPSFKTFHKGPHRGGYQRNNNHPRGERTEGSNSEFSTYQRNPNKKFGKPYQKDPTSQSQLSSSPS
jgi:hypothetical protein